MRFIIPEKVKRITLKIFIATNSHDTITLICLVISTLNQLNGMQIDMTCITTILYIKNNHAFQNNNATNATHRCLVV